MLPLAVSKWVLEGGEAEVLDELACRHPARFVMKAAQLEPALPPAPAVRLAKSSLEKGDAVVLCTDGSAQGLRSILARRLHISEEEVSLLDTWPDAEAPSAGRIGVMRRPLQAGFQLPNQTIIAVRTRARRRGRPTLTGH